MPRRVRARMSVEQNDRGPLAAVAHAQLDLVQSDRIELETLEHDVLFAGVRRQVLRADERRTSRARAVEL